MFLLHCNSCFSLISSPLAFLPSVPPPHPYHDHHQSDSHHCATGMSNSPLNGLFCASVTYSPQSIRSSHSKTQFCSCYFPSLNLELLLGLGANNSAGIEKSSGPDPCLLHEFYFSTHPPYSKPTFHPGWIIFMTSEGTPLLLCPGCSCVECPLQ